MRDTMTASTEQWMQFYDQQSPPIDGSVHEAPTRWGLERADVRRLIPGTEEAISDATLMTINPTPTMPLDTMILSPTSSYTNNIGHLTPKGSVSKPIRRRSRASKRTPTTLLNANTKNFRALVQQFTGCPSSTLSSTSSSSLAIHKGPITLNFQQGSKEIHHENTAKGISQFSSRSYNHVHQVPVSFPQQQNGYSFDHVKNNNFVPTLGNNSSSRPSTSNMNVSDGLLVVVDNDFSLHDLTVNAFSNDAF